MLPSKRGLLLLFTILSASSAGFFCHAQSAQQSLPVRYNFGDDPDGRLGWANPNFDDSAWPLAQNGLVPSRSRETNRFLWVRVRVPVPNDLNTPLALHLDNLGIQPMAWQVFVNGQSLGARALSRPTQLPPIPPSHP